MLIQAFYGLVMGQDPNSYFNSSEFLINYEGGFVRRGLLGQILLMLCKYTCWPPVTVITISCIIIFAVTLAFYLIKFSKMKLNLWILLSPLMFGMALEIIRKDYLTYLLAIAMLLLVSKNKISVPQYIAVIILIVFGLLVHEAFMFYGIPIVLLIMWYKCDNRIAAITAILVTLATFALLSLYKGDNDIATQIIKSWDHMGPDNTPLLTSRVNAVGAIGWETIDTIRKHLRFNFVSFGSGLGRYGLIYQPLTMFIVYYFIMNFTPIFSDTKSADSRRTTLSAISIFVLICLLPMFIGLSCDYGRLYQYVFMMTYAVFLIIPHSQIVNIFPKWYISLLTNINRTINKLIPPSKGIMIIILLFFAVNPYSFDPLGTIKNSVVFTDFHLLDSLLINIK